MQCSALFYINISTHHKTVIYARAEYNDYFFALLKVEMWLRWVSGVCILCNVSKSTIRGSANW